MTLRCPHCSHGETAVVTSVANRGRDRMPERKRYGKCKACGHNFTTDERLTEQDAARARNCLPLP